MEQLTNAADYPLGKDLVGLPERLDSLPRWSTNAPPTQALFLRYLGELQNAGAVRYPWITNYSIPVPEDDVNDRGYKFQIFYQCWKTNVPSSQTNPVFSKNYFYDTWLKLGDFENDWQELRRLQMNSVEDLLRLIPDSLDKTAYVGLFIVDPKQPAARAGDDSF